MKPTTYWADYLAKTVSKQVCFCCFCAQVDWVSVISLGTSVTSAKKNYMTILDLKNEKQKDWL